MNTTQPVPEQLAHRAWEILCTNLTRYGNTLSESHRFSLDYLMRSLAELAFGIKRGRLAYPLGCGLGKTQAIVAFCTAVHELQFDHVSVAVSASKVEALCKLKRDLIGNGVPEEKVGLLHAYKFDSARIKNGEPEDGYATLPATEDHDQRQFQLVTHNRVKGRGDMRKFTQYRDARRSLLIWDESLLISDARAIPRIELASSLGWIAPRIGEDQPVVRYLRRGLELIGGEIQIQKDEQREPRPIQLPPLGWETIVDFKQSLGTSPIVSLLKQLLEMSQEQLRAVYTTHTEGQGLVTYDITVPQELDSVAVLDASYPIRLLERMDKTISLGAHFPSDIKRHDRVTIHHLKSASGRGSVTKDFVSDRHISAEVCELIRTEIASEDAVIIWTFKPRDEWGERGAARRKVKFADILRQDMETAGIDTNDEVFVPVWRDGGWVVETRPRFIFLTWGQETSLSEYAYAKHVIFAGVLHRSHLDLASFIVGQQDNLWAPVSARELRETMVSEVAHSVYQAMCRGACRIIEGNQAKEMHAWLIHADDHIRPHLEKVMPGVKWVEWQGRHLKPKGKRSKLAKAILEHLEALPAELTKLSVQSLRTHPSFKSIARNTFGRALDDALDQTVHWERQARSLIRVNWADVFAEAA